jgi:hypothetical protein
MKEKGTEHLKKVKEVLRGTQAMARNNEITKISVKRKGGRRALKRDTQCSG